VTAKHHHASPQYSSTSPIENTTPNGAGRGITSLRGCNTSTSDIRWCFAPSSIATTPCAPAMRIASAPTGIPPFSPTTARFIKRPTAMSTDPGTRRFTATTANSST
jgi:hypothetical protein